MGPRLWACALGRHDTQHNDILLTDTQQCIKNVALSIRTLVEYCMLGIFKLSDCLLSRVMLSAFVLGVIMLSVILLNVAVTLIMISVVILMVVYV